MYAAVLGVHSIVRWLVLLALGARVLRGAQGMATGAERSGLDRGLSGTALGLTHLQVVMGLGLWMLSPKAQQGFADMGAAMKDSVLRFWVVEHPFTMILGAAAVQIGFSLSRRASSDSAAHRIATIGFGVGLLFILAGIPWAFRGAL